MAHHRGTVYFVLLSAAHAAILALTAADAMSEAIREQNSMVLVPAGEWVVGTTTKERSALAKRFDCHPTWLGDDLPRRSVRLAAFWIDKHPVTNAAYLAFCKATSRRGPSWWRDGLKFPAEYADHPVVGVCGKDARAYAKWAGKRLPTAEQWEAAMGGSEKLFPWGDEWPGPLKLRRFGQPNWQLPSTRPVGAGGCGRAAGGVGDFAGQCLEWVDRLIPHHGVQFQLMKGASWLHEDPLNFRTASGWYAYEGWRSAFTGFRCALDAAKAPPAVPRATPAGPPSLAALRKQAAGPPRAGPIALTAGGGASRGLSLHAPFLGPQAVHLSAPETIYWGGRAALTWRHRPEMTWTERTGRRAAYTMRFSDFTLRAEFIAHADAAEQRFTAVSAADKAATFRTSSCFNLQHHPLFYDPEQLRTYVLKADGTFAPMRRFSRGGDCVRWIAGMNRPELGKDLRWALLAVVSRDGKAVIATGRAGQGRGYSVVTNTLFTCLHADSTIDVPANGKATTVQRFYFLKGNLDDLLKRFRADFGL